MEPASAQARVVLVCSDLFFAAQLRAAAERQRAAVELELEPSRAAARACERACHLLVIDLETTGLDLAALLAELGGPQRPPVVAFGPHVQTERLRAAREAGCDHVVPRSRAAATVARILGGGA